MFGETFRGRSMAKALFQRNQKVWVESVGAWTVVERIVPIWARGFDEPVRVTYDVGLGREFHAHELRAEEDGAERLVEDGARWRLMRARNKWQTPAECSHHPFPGTYPVIVTDANDWGGWRVPGAEYDRDAAKIEFQARLIASSPALLNLARALLAMVDEMPDDAPVEIRTLAEEAQRIDRYLKEVPAAMTPTEAKDVEAA
jgi:hypothetical protein